MVEEIPARTGKMGQFYLGFQTYTNFFLQIKHRKVVQVHKRATKKHSVSVCLVGLSGLEPPTPTLSGWCSNLLSYNPILWWRYTDSFNSERLCLHNEASVSEDSSSGTSQSDALRPQRNAGIFTCGGDTRIRTEDLLNANQALYQLSYIPT